ncbi:UbiA family prenyltransferase [Thalassobius aquimarinus]|uniref:UbiA family prenyltransferase n=2 Tax=Thalassovita aquimarina TaxID=2785917 RepID=A0ABS5HRP0_9RHOB|nr:UbiA family prenyltransferase [Thalassovita aquimarina]
MNTMPDTVDPHSDPAAIPLFVDMDGTLLRTDVAQELLLRSFKSPAALCAVLSGGVSHGVSGVKRALSEKTGFRADLLPYDADVLDYVKKARRDGRRVVLATAADSKVARAVADHTGVFDDVVATEPGRNMKGAAKLAAIRDAAGPEGFEYLGDSRADLPIWRAARLRGFAAIPARARDMAGEATLLPRRRAPFWSALLRAMRPGHWALNLFVFLPILFANLYADPAGLLRTFGAFVAFSLCASAICLIGAMLDVEADRADAVRRKGPFAAGDLTPKAGGAAALLLMLAGLGTGFGVAGWVLGLVLSAYLTAALAHALWLKSSPVIGALVLVLLFALRIVAGAVAVQLLP